MPREMFTAYSLHPSGGLMSPKYPYQLWDLDCGNIVGGYDSEAAAMEIVKNSFVQFGPDSVTTLALIHTSDDDTPETVAEGSMLLARAERAYMLESS